MEIPAERWYDAVQVRRSRRKYLTKEIEGQVLKQLKEVNQKLNDSIEGVRIAIVEEGSEEVFTGIIGSYGSIKGAPCYAVFIGDMEDDNYQEKVGYLGESFILEATCQGLGTCWIGGFFEPEKVKEEVSVEENEEVVAISPIGYTRNKYSLGEKIMSKLASSHKRKELNELCREEFDDNWPQWVKTALKCARLAPSAVNRQPWRFKVRKDAVVVSVDTPDSSFSVSKRLDCGIAMLHLEVGAMYEGVKGSWRYLDSPEVAEFKVKKNI